MTQEKLNQLTENGKYEVKQITVKDKDKTYSAVFKMDFPLLRKAMAALLNMDMEKGSGKDVKIDVSIDELGAGDKVLFFGWVEGDEEIKQRMLLRQQACKKLGAWVQDIANMGEDEEEEKKS